MKFGSYLFNCFNFVSINNFFFLFCAMTHNALPAAAWQVLIGLCLLSVVHSADPGSDC